MDFLLATMPSATEMSYEAHEVSPGLKAGTGSLRSSKSPATDIIDIRRAAVELNLKEEIHQMLRPQEGPRRLPTLLLYDEKGLQLFEQVNITTSQVDTYDALTD